METNEIIALIDAEVQRLQQARAVLSGISVKPRARRVTKAAKSAPPVKRRRSAEVRARMAAAQKARYAKLRESAK